MVKNITNKAAQKHLLNRLDQLTPQSTRRWGTMDAQEMLCHCADAFRMTFGEKPCKNKSNILTRTMGKFLFLNVLPMPRGLPTAPELLHDKKGTPQTNWEKDKQALIELIERFCNTPENHTWGIHPFFGKLSYQDWGKLAFRHLDHHFKQFNI